MATRTQKNGNARSEEKKEPVHSVNFYSGGGYIEVAVWENMVGEGENERLAYGVSLKRSYKDGNDWKDTKSFRAQDLPHVAVALQQAYLWIQEQQQKR